MESRDGSTLSPKRAWPRRPNSERAPIGPTPARRPLALGLPTMPTPVAPMLPTPALTPPLPTPAVPLTPTPPTPAAAPALTPPVPTPAAPLTPPAAAPALAPPLPTPALPLTPPAAAPALAPPLPTPAVAPTPPALAPTPALPAEAVPAPDGSCTAGRRGAKSSTSERPTTPERDERAWRVIAVSSLGRREEAIRPTTFCLRRWLQSAAKTIM